MHASVVAFPSTLIPCQIKSKDRWMEVLQSSPVQIVVAMGKIEEGSWLSLVFLMMSGM